MEDTKDAVLAANDAFYQAFNLKDTALMDSLWAAHAAVTCIHPGWNVLQGRDDVLQSWRRILENPNQARIVTGGASASVFGEIAVVVCRELVGGSPLLATNIFVLEGEAWKLLHHQSGAVFQA